MSLRNVLQWYATVDPAVGYCQGMGFLVGMLLTYLVDEEAFYCFYAAMQLPRYNLRELFHPSMKGSRQLIYTFGQLMKLHMGRLFRHMSEQGVYPSMYVTGWIMTLFSRDFSFDLCTRVWEIFLSEGIKIVYRVCLALLKNIESQLLAMPFEEILTTIRNIPATVDAPHIIELGCSISVRRKELAAISVKFNKMLDSGNNDEIY